MSVNCTQLLIICLNGRRVSKSRREEALGCKSQMGEGRMRLREQWGTIFVGVCAHA